ncbi:MAG: amidohydrolase family protein [Bacillota bacterium]|jgi:imidazolonepropionase-like amidohydrolase|nr:amidohydrolase family protein [Candidatus Fermentithermobacillaceae bacterium]
MQRKLFRDAKVLSLRTGRYAQEMDVLVENGTIAAIGRNLECADAEVVECEGRYMTPSLIDAHVHMICEEMGLQCIVCGVTAVRHLSGGEGVLRYARDIRAGRRAGPYIYSSGPIVDGAGARYKSPSHVYIDGPEQAAQAVRDTVEAGYLWAKAYPSMTPEEMESFLQEAKRLNIRVSGHLSYYADPKALADLGYACCEHSSSLPKNDEDIDYLADSGMWFCPTQLVCETLPDYVWKEKPLSEAAGYEYLSEASRKYWEERNKKIIAEYKERNLKPDINVIIARGRRFMDRSDRYMAGSDAMYPGVVAGFGLHAELRKLVDLYGLAPLDALRAATMKPAECMGLSACKGQIAPGMDADLLLLERDPLEDISNLLSIHMVIQGERVYGRRQLDRMLDELKDPRREFEVFEPTFLF